MRSPKINTDNEPVFVLICECGSPCEVVVGRCDLCNTPEPEVKLHPIGRGMYCYHCAVELFE